MVFIILIFFIVTTSFVRENGIDVERPESSLTMAIPGSFVIISIADSGSVYLNDQLIDAQDDQQIAQSLHQLRSQHVVIEADRSVPLHIFTSVQDSCYRAGAERVDLATHASGTVR
jgi:biopolymer transport protein ExbD